MTKETPIGGMNARARNENIGGTAPGIPDDARGPGESVPKAPTDAEVDEAARKLGASGRGQADGSG